MNLTNPQNRLRIVALLDVASPGFLLDSVVRWGVAVWLLTHRENE